MEQKIDKAAREYFENEVINGDTQDDKYGWADCFKAVAAYALSNQWRSVEDNPPIDEDVIVDYPYEHGHAVGYYDGEDWYMTENGRLIRPTHWMPIPALPQERKEE